MKQVRVVYDVSKFNHFGTSPFVRWPIQTVTDVGQYIDNCSDHFGKMATFAVYQIEGNTERCIFSIDDCDARYQEYISG